jgi:hypothetical protein
MWRAPCKGGVYQWVRDPPGYRASPRAVEPQLLHIHSSLVEHRSEVGRTSPYTPALEYGNSLTWNGKSLRKIGTSATANIKTH